MLPPTKEMMLRHSEQGIEEEPQFNLPPARVKAEPPYALHSTGIGTADRCLRLFFLTDPYWGEGWTTPLEPLPFWTGTIAHETLQGYYEQGLGMDHSFGLAAKRNREKLEARAGPFLLNDETYQPYKDDLVMLLGAMRNYELWQANDTSEWGDANLMHLAVEHDWEVMYHPEEGAPFPLRGRFDGLVKRRDDGTYWLFETKTARNIAELKAGLPWDHQRMLYTWAAKVGLGLDIQGVLYNIIQKSNPFLIPTLKNGLPSKAVRSTVQTTYEAYEAELAKRIEEKALTEKEQVKIWGRYEGELMYLFKEAPKLCERLPYRATPQELDQELYWTEILYRHLEDVGHLRWARPAKNRFDCPKCPFKHVCLSMEEQGSWQDILKVQFTRKGHYYD